ncbi:hypothetical protein AB1Y20_019820 [Prymnesium parvum]|uniref:Centrosomal protein of 162 kDa n=1 Tax=Prymnesium parvum TaxID=97485 RepID=A0AB34JTD5_PRYPA
MGEGEVRPPSHTGEAQRYEWLRRRLSELRYDLPLGLESAPLVEALVSDLGHANDRVKALTAQIDAQAQSLILAENTAHPLRKENGRLLRENNQLHMELIRRAEEGEKALKEQKALAARLQKQNNDLTFVNSQQVARVRALEETNSGLRDRFNDALQENGVVLPSGHEVRWHGRKEHMQAHSPVLAASTVAERDGSDSPTTVVGDVAGLLQASEQQVSQLQARLQELQAKATSMEDELLSSKAQLQRREEEIARLARQLESGRDFDKLSLMHVDQSRKEAIAQLNDQVDFLNEQCAAMEGELHTKRLAHVRATQLQTELDGLHAELDDARAQKEDMRSELEHALRAIQALKARDLSYFDMPEIASGGATERAKKAEAEAESLKAAMQEQRKSAADQLGALEERATRAEADASAAREMYAAYQSDKKRLGEQLQELHEDRKSLEAELFETRSRATTCERRMEAQQAELANLAGALKSAQMQCHRCEGEIARLQGERDALERTGSSLRAELEAARQGAVELRSSRAAVDAQQASQRREKEALEMQLAALEATRAEMREEISAYHTQAEQLQTLLGAHEAERHEIVREVDRLTQLLQGERAATASLRTEISSLQHRLQEQQEAGKSLHQVRATPPSSCLPVCLVCTPTSPNRPPQAMKSEREELIEAQMASRRAESDAALLRRQLLELELTRSQLADAQASLNEARGASQQAQAERQQEALRAERLSGQLGVLRTEVDELRASLREAVEERDQLLMLTSELEARSYSTAEERGEAASERDAATARLGRVESELSAARELIRSLQRDSDGGVTARRRLEDELSEAKQQAGFAREDCRRVKQRADGLAEQLERSNSLVEDLRQQLGEAEEGRRACETALEEVQAKLAREKEASHSAEAAAQTFQAQLDSSRAAEREREAEVSQLKSLVSRMDVGRKEIAEKLTATLRKLHEAEQAHQALNNQLEANAQALRERDATIDQLRQVVASLDKERDALLVELDEKAEELSHQRTSCQNATQAAADFERQLSQVREQSMRQAELLAAADCVRSALEERLAEAGRSEARLVSESQETEAELAATADDLRKMIRENQILNEELQRSGQQRENLQRELHLKSSRVMHLEQLTKADEMEKEELLSAYRRLGDESAALRLSMQQTAHERDIMLAQLDGVKQEVAEQQAMSHQTHEENAKLLVDIQAFARQNEQLVAQLAALENALQQEGTERTVMQRELASTRQLLSGLERSRESIQRDAAGASHEITRLQAKLIEATREREAVKQQLELERGRCAQLENLASTLRTTIQRESAAQSETLKEAVSVRTQHRELTESNGQHEVELRMLRQTNEEQKHEIDTLRRALGTASFERDAAARKLEARGEHGSPGRSAEVYQRQCETIKELDADRSRLRLEVERLAQRADATQRQNESLTRQLEQAKEAHALQHAQAASALNALRMAEAERDQAKLELHRPAASDGAAAYSEATDLRRQLAAARTQGAELTALLDSAKLELRSQAKDIETQRAAAQALQHQYDVLLRQHELLLESEHALRFQLNERSDELYSWDDEDTTGHFRVEGDRAFDASFMAELDSLEQASMARAEQLDTVAESLSDLAPHE